jgi:hypothetical protein
MPPLSFHIADKSIPIDSNKYLHPVQYRYPFSPLSLPSMPWWTPLIFLLLLDPVGSVLLHATLFSSGLSFKITLETLPVFVFTLRRFTMILAYNEHNADKYRLQY